MSADKLSLATIKTFLQNYNGETITIMEVCGSHTAAIEKSGIRDIISDKIQLVSGPGCPVCVTPSAYIDKLIDLSKEPNTCVVTFGDMLRVPGSNKSLSEAQGEKAQVKMVYSPADTIKLAMDNPNTNYVFAAVGFETTTPVYALLLENIISKKINNIKLLTALKTMPSVISWLCDNNAYIDGFLAPGHVCAVTGSKAFEPQARKYGMPFVVAGFTPELLLEAIYGVANMVIGKRNNTNKDYGRVLNFYPKVVTYDGNECAHDLVNKYFKPCDAVWRGIGKVEGSGLVLKDEYRNYDAGSLNLTVDKKINDLCCCDKVLTGKIKPSQCPLFKNKCNPRNPQGACMVSLEGSCYQHFLHS